MILQFSYILSSEMDVARTYSQVQCVPSIFQNKDFAQGNHYHYSREGVIY